jgi:hypothetical protein
VITTGAPNRRVVGGRAWRGVWAALLVDVVCAIALFLAIAWDRLAREGFRSAPVTAAEFREWLVAFAGWGLVMAAVAVVGLVLERPEVVITQILVIPVVLACWTPFLRQGWNGIQVTRQAPPVDAPPTTGGPWCFGGHGDCPGG